MDGEIHEVTTNNFEQMCMYTPDFFYDNPEMQLKDIYSLLRYKQYNKAFALEELELYYGWIKEKTAEITALYEELKEKILAWEVPVLPDS